MNNIANLFSNQVFQTILSGVIVFVSGQIFIRFIIEPIQELNKTIGKIAFQLKFYANVYTNSNISPKTYWEVSKVLRELASNLEANYYTIPLKDVFSFLQIIPSFKQLSKASRSLISLSNSAGDKESTINNSVVADQIRDSLRIKTLNDS